MAELTSWIDKCAVINDESFAAVVEGWRRERKEIQARRQAAKPRDQRLRELAANMVEQRKEVDKKQRLVDAAAANVAAAQSALKESEELLSKKQAKLEELEEEQRTLIAAVPAAEVVDATTATMSKERLAFVLGAARGAGPAEGGELEAAWTQYQEAEKKRNEQAKADAETRAAERRAAAAAEAERDGEEERKEMQVDSIDLDSLLADEDPEIRERLVQKRAKLIDEASAKRQRV